MSRCLSVGSHFAPIGKVRRSSLIKRAVHLPELCRKPFGLRWFVPELLREWRLFADVAVAAILLYGLGLATPIFFQLVIEKFWCTRASQRCMC